MSGGSAVANGAYGGNGIFTKGIGRDAAAEQVSVRGDADLGVHVLRMIAIVG